MPGSCDVLHRSLLELRDFAAEIGLVKVLKGEVGATRVVAAAASRPRNLDPGHRPLSASRTPLMRRMRSSGAAA